MGEADIAVIGTGVMGGNLALNMASKGFGVALHDLDPSKPRTLAAGEHGQRFFVAEDLPSLVAAVRAPRPFVMLAPAGKAVDELVAALSPHLSEGDILVDAGNSDFHDTERRTAEAESRGQAFLGMGVSGGAEGARRGPAIMAGGSRGVWERVAPIMERIAAQHDGKPCAAWLGPGGAGHFVKTAHNGIEYAIMQMIAEAWGVLRDGYRLGPRDAAEHFRVWGDGPLDSYLMEIAAEVLAAPDPHGEGPLIDVILDRAGQKGTGLWTAVEAQKLGAPATTVEAALVARSLSAQRERRLDAASILGAPAKPVEGDAARRALRSALIAGTVTAYAQGFALIEAASDAHGWDVSLPDVARVWRAGCIIRSSLLDPMAEALAPRDDAMPPLLGDPHFARLIDETDGALREVVAACARHGLPAPALMASLGWLDTLRSPRTTADMIQGLRDRFGLHGFERTDREGGGFHGPWA